jgi:hypothetical protein
MRTEHERRRGADRRVHFRGGRRPEDRDGYAPLVFVVTREPSHLLFWEALLLNLKFAVVPCDGPGPALEAFRALRPDVILVSARDKAMLRDRLPSGRQGTPVPLVELVSTPDLIEPVIQAIRRALHESQMATS